MISQIVANESFHKNLRYHKHLGANTIPISNLFAIFLVTNLRYHKEGMALAAIRSAIQIEMLITELA